MSPKQQAIQLISQGISTSQVAAACGVDDSYISQLKADPDVQLELARLAAETTVADATFDSTLESAELKALQKIEAGLPFANIGQAMQAFRVLNGARRRKDGIVTPGDLVTVNVTLNLPESSVPRYVTNKANEIIEVEGKTMVSATARSLDDILRARADGEAGQLSLPRNTAVEKAAKQLHSLVPLPPQRARALPATLSVDIL